MKNFYTQMKKMKNLIELCKMTQKELTNYLPKWLMKNGYNNVSRLKKGYVYAKGELPIMLVAHLDTVHHERVKDVFINIEDLDTISSPQGLGGDDRCGVYIIQRIIKNGFKPSVLFCCDEEIGCLGASKFCEKHETIDNVNFIVEFDRRGFTDCVRYEDDNMRLTEILEQFGWKEEFGSCSDISELAPHFKVSAVNLSSGYYKEHHQDTTIVFSEVQKIIKRFIEFLKSDYIYEKIEYIERQYTYSNYYNRGGKFDYMDWYYGHNISHITKDEEGTTVKVCDCCGEIVDDDAEYIEGMLCCKDCVDQWVRNLDLRRCPYCNEFVYKDDIMCESCGYPLDQEDDDIEEIKDENKEVVGYEVNY